MDLQFANAWERVADIVPDYTAIVQGDRRYSYRVFETSRHDSPEPSPKPESATAVPSGSISTTRRST